MTDDKTFDIVSPEVGAVTKMAIQSSSSSNSIKVNGLQFAYEGQPPLFLDFNLQISPGSRCLLVGANGSGTFLARLFPRKSVSRKFENLNLSQKCR